MLEGIGDAHTLIRIPQHRDEGMRLHPSTRKICIHAYVAARSTRQLLGADPDSD